MLPHAEAVKDVDHQGVVTSINDVFSIHNVYRKWMFMRCEGVQWDAVTLSSSSSSIC